MPKALSSSFAPFKAPLASLGDGGRVLARTRISLLRGPSRKIDHVPCPLIQIAWTLGVLWCHASSMHAGSSLANRPSLYDSALFGWTTTRSPDVAQREAVRC